MISRVDQCNSIGTFSGHTAIQTKRDMQTFLGSTDLCGFRGRIINMSMFNDIEHRKPRANMSRKRERGDQKCNAIPTGSLVFLWTWKRKSVVTYDLGQTSQRRGSHRQERDTEV